jgi:hypothetical protein
MGYLLDATTIRSPYEITESNDTQVAVQRTLDGSINRDYFGNNKRIWELKYVNSKKTDYDTINTIYQSYLSTGTTKAFEVTETNYTIASVSVHVDLLERGFTIRGSDYLSDFSLILTEA